MSSQIVVTIRKEKRIGEYDWQMESFSRVFDTSRSLDDMLSFAKTMGIDAPTVNDLSFHVHTGSSY